MEKSYRSGNLQVCAFLVASGAVLDRCELTRPNRCEFFFGDEDGYIAKLADTYFEGAKCSAIDYYRALLDLRTRINRTLGVSRG
jgi:hypothetical protein